MTCKACRREHSPLVRCEVAARRSAVSDVPATNNVTDCVTDGRELSAAAGRMRRWRDAHLNENRERQRELMRKRRERERAGLRKEGA